MKISQLKKYSYVVIIAVIFSSLALPPSTYSQTELMLLQKGISYATWDRDRFLSQYSDESLAKIASLGTEFISICVTLYQEKYNSVDIKTTDRTSSDKSLRHVIKTAHKLGLKIMLKPHIDLMDKFDGTYWRADIGFHSEEDWEKWFKGYQKLITHYARMAEKYNVEIFCVGTELSFTSQREDNWREVISKVRKVYKGKLVYAANWDNFKNIKFWDELDFIGIDAYFPLCYLEKPTLEDLKKGWEKWQYDIETFAATTTKKIIFTEIGYPSTSNAPQTPWEAATVGNADPEIQALCYKAFFETIWEKPWLAGVYWWKWDTNTRAGGVNNRRFTPQNKPAQEIMAEYYKKAEKIIHSL